MAYRLQDITFIISEITGVMAIIYATNSPEPVLNENRHLPCKEIAKSVRQSIAKHTDGAIQSDDITMLVTEYFFTNVGEWDDGCEK